MTGWIDPLGAHIIMKYINNEQTRLFRLMKENEKLHPKSRRASRYRGRYKELSRIRAMIHAVMREGKELKSYKMLVHLDPNRRKEMENTINNIRAFK